MYSLTVINILQGFRFSHFYESYEINRNEKALDLLKEFFKKNK